MIECGAFSNKYLCLGIIFLQVANICFKTMSKMQHCRVSPNDVKVMDRDLPYWHLQLFFQGRQHRNSIFQKLQLHFFSQPNCLVRIGHC